MNLPNTISIARFLTMPILLLLAWYGYRWLFLVILVLCFFSDVLDGYIARRYNLQTEFGAKLDSWSDFVLYSTMVAGGVLLWPEIMDRERLYIIAIIVSFVLPSAIGFLKFGKLPSYHTWSVKLASLAVGGSGILLFAGGPAWLFHAAWPISIVAAIEQTLITFLLNEPRTNIATFWHARRYLRSPLK